MSEPDEVKELRLVDRVELNIALADTDSKLEKLLKTYLAPVILKLASPHAAVRNKVVALCQHINARIKPASIGLPVPALLAQFKDPAVGGSYPMIRNFDLMYITAGIDRMPVPERLDLLPVIVKDISTHSNAHHQRSLFNILIRLLPHFVPPPRGTTEDATLREKFGFNERPEDAKWLSKWFGKLMLLNLLALTGSENSNASIGGLSDPEVDFLTLSRNKETFQSFSVFTEIKVAVLKFLSSGAFTDKERYLPSLIASADTNSAVSERADDVFKRSLPSVSLEEDATIEELSSLLLVGSYGVESSRLSLQIKVVGLLSKSRKAVERGRQKIIMDIVEMGFETKYSKLRQAIFGFVTWAARMADDKLMELVAPSIMEKLRYWIISDTDAGDDIRGFAYETNALLGSRSMSLVLEPRLDIIRFLFRQLGKERGGVVSSVESSLGILLSKIAREPLNEEVESEMEDFLLKTMEEETRAVSQAAKWAGRIIPFNKPSGRWIALLAVGMGGPVGEEGAKALDPYQYRLINPEALGVYRLASDLPNLGVDKFTMPRFSDLVHYIFSEPHVLPQSFTSMKLVHGILPPKSFAVAVELCKRVAFCEALSPSKLEIKINEDWGRNVDVSVTTDDEARALVEEFLHGQTQTNFAEINMFLRSAWGGMTYDGEGLDQVRGVWNEMAVLAPPRITNEFAEKLGELRKLLSAPKEATRRAAAFAFGILGSSSAIEESRLKEMITELVTAVEASQHGAVLAFGFIVSRLKLRGRKYADRSLLLRGMKAITEILMNSHEALLVEAATEALGELAVYSILDKDELDMSKIRETLIKKAKDEKTILTLSYLALLYDEKSKEAEEIMAEITKLAESGGVETSFVTGEAIVTAAAGWSCSAVRRAPGRVMAGVQWDGGKRNGIGELLDQTLAKASEPGGGGKRRATCVRLLSIVEYCGQLQEVKAKLGQAQKAFRAFLTDRDDFIQESASRGLSAIYNLSDEETKSELVRSLVSSFTGETREKITVNRDTQLFEQGALPTGEGSSVGSYGDIMSLAAELGDPSLVYKFMSMARHNSVWASRAAFGRFGLGTILSSSSEVKENKKLWPVLYRYRFDPSPTVRQSMGSIWEALGGNSETVERWWRDIIDECMRGAVRGSEWRVREASLNALADVLGGRKVSQYKDLLEKIWGIAFKVLDDVKESVRLAALKLCRVLATSTARALEADSSEKDKREILGTLMHFLMGTQGIEAQAKEVSQFALQTLLKVIKTAGSSIREWIPSLVEKMLILLTDVEPEVINYLHLNADKYNTSGDELDRLRLQSIKASPIMSTLEDILDKLDEETMSNLVPQLTKSIRTAIGLPTKVGCSRLLVSLVMRRPLLVRRYADEFCRVTLSAVKDRNETVSSAYAGAIGYLCRVSSDRGLLSTVLWAQTSYWEGEDEKRLLAGRVVGAIYKQATDKANSLAKDILPFVFIAKHDIEKVVQEEFSTTWSENTGGSGAVKLYLSEIIELVQTHFPSPRWAIKQTCALAVAAAANAIGSDITAEQLQILWPIMVTTTAGKSWAGKEEVLAAMVNLAVNGKRHFNAEDERVKELENIVLREAKRNNPPYRSSALKSLGRFADSFPNLNLFEAVYSIVDSAITPIDDDAMDIDGSDGRSLGSIQQITIMNGLKAMSLALRPNLHLKSSTIRDDVSRLLDMMDSHMIGGQYEMRSCSIECTAIILERLATVRSTGSLDGFTQDELLIRLWNRSVEHAKDRGHENGRLEAAVAFEHFTKFQCGKGLEEKIKQDIKGVLEAERSPIVLQKLQPASAALLR